MLLCTQRGTLRDKLQSCSPLLCLLFISVLLMSVCLLCYFVPIFFEFITLSSAQDCAVFVNIYFSLIIIIHSMLIACFQLTFSVLMLMHLLFA